jgi:hypothetical protein
MLVTHGTSRTIERSKSLFCNKWYEGSYWAFFSIFFLFFPFFLSQPNSTSTQVVIDKVVRWTTHSTHHHLKTCLFKSVKVYVGDPWDLTDNRKIKISILTQIERQPTKKNERQPTKKWKTTYILLLIN